MALIDEIRKNRELLNRPNYTRAMSTMRTPTSTATVAQRATPSFVSPQTLRPTGIGSVTPTTPTTGVSASIPPVTAGPSRLLSSGVFKATSTVAKPTGQIGRALQRVGDVVQEPARALTGGRTFMEQVGAVGRGEVSPIIGGPTATFKLGSALVGETLAGWGRTLEAVSQKGVSAFNPAPIAETYKKSYEQTGSGLQATLEALSTQETENILNLTDLVPGGKVLEAVPFVAGLIKNLDNTDEVLAVAKDLNKLQDITRVTSNVIKKGGIVPENVSNTTTWSKTKRYC